MPLRRRDQVTSCATEKKLGNRIDAAGFPLFALLEPVHQPRLGNQEKRRQENPQQRVEPNERQVESDQAKRDPKRTEWTVRFHSLLQTCGGLD